MLIQGDPSIQTRSFVKREALELKVARDPQTAREDETAEDRESDR